MPRTTGHTGQQSHAHGAAQHGGAGVPTTDHDEIRRWVEERGGKPAAVRSTHDKREIGILRVEFPDAPNPHDENLEEISWEEFFNKFEQAKLAFLHQDTTADGQVSRFFKLIRR